MIRKLSAILTVLITKIYFATASELFVYPSVFNNSTRDEFEIGTFPDDFSFGAATSAYQIEGAWNVNGKGVNIWDTFTHNPKSHVHKGETGDVADDSYYLWDRDIEILKELGKILFLSLPHTCLIESYPMRQILTLIFCSLTVVDSGFKAEK